MKRALPLWVLLVCGCGPTTRTYEVLVDQEKVCRTFGSLMESCADTGSPGISLRMTLEDRGDGTAVLHGRSDSSAVRTYQARVPRPGRYEVDERATQTNSNTRCVTQTSLVLVLNVDDKGLDGGEETRTEESRECNELRERRVTVRSREWAGSRLD